MESDQLHQIAVSNNHNTMYDTATMWSTGGRNEKRIGVVTIRSPMMQRPKRRNGDAHISSVPGLTAMH